MKKSTTLFSLLLASIPASGWASTTSTSSNVVSAPVPVTHVYAPLGFDSNDNTEVIVKGYLPNLCYRAPRAEPKVNGNTIDIQVSALRPTEHVMCAQIVLPFMESAQVGVLDQGNYGIVVNPSESNSRTSQIKIAEAISSAVDDYVYADVATVERIPGTRTVALKGQNPVSCYDLDQIKYISNGKDTYSVLPILKKVSDNCESKPVSFNYYWDVPTDLSSIEKEPLLHVRVMNGKSVNVLFDETE